MFLVKSDSKNMGGIVSQDDWLVGLKSELDVVDSTSVTFMFEVILKLHRSFNSHDTAKGFRCTQLFHYTELMGT